MASKKKLASVTTPNIGGGTSVTLCLVTLVYFRGKRVMLE